MTEHIVISSAQGNLDGFLNLPGGTDKVPVVIAAHGWLGDAQSKRNDLLAEWLNEEGIGLLAFSFSGHGASAGDINLFNPLRGAGQVAAAVKFLADVPRADLSRLGIVGVSIGGSVALLAMAQSQAFRCGVLISPRTDFHQAHDEMYFDAERKIANKSMLQAGREINFYRQAAKVQVPVLVIHGTKDPDIPYDQSARLTEFENFTLLPIPQGDHIMHRHLRLIVGESAEFLRKNLQ
jgi:dipeptidyl aminopeptidase/acylaminoacyl peptidase